MKLKKELPILVVAVLPILYLAYIYADLPQSVPIHWNAQGEIDGYGDKSTLWLIPFAMPILIYVILSVTPYIDPKKQLEKMGDKFYQLKFLTVLIMSALALYILYAALTASLTDFRIIYVLIGVLFAGLGNFMPSLKPNYFIGVRTPWTLESETVWKRTHRLTGKLWVLAGIGIILGAFLIPSDYYLYVFITVTLIITIVPIYLSYKWFKSDKVMENK